MTDTKKYVIRFAIIIAIVLPILLLTQGQATLKIIAYKVCLVTLAVGLAELIWAGFFKPVYGKTEGMTANEKQSIMVFRGILYAAIILALTLGL